MRNTGHGRRIDKEYMTPQERNVVAVRKYQKTKKGIAAKQRWEKNNKGRAREFRVNYVRRMRENPLFREFEAKKQSIYRVSKLTGTSIEEISERWGMPRTWEDYKWSRVDYSQHDVITND